MIYTKACIKWRKAKVSTLHEGNRHFAQGRQFKRMADYTDAELGISIWLTGQQIVNDQPQNAYTRNNIRRRVLLVIVILQACTRG